MAEAGYLNIILNSQLAPGSFQTKTIALIACLK